MTAADFMNENEEYYCLVLKTNIPEMECYETCNGCMDTLVHIHSLQSRQQIKDICCLCKHSDYN